jgi:diguanylate cyclase (GGDEF)-like protein
MKFVRLGALFGSIVLLVATSITMFGKRSQMRAELDSRAVAAAFVAAESVQSTIDRSVAVVDVAAQSTDVSSGSDSTIEALVLSFDGGQACVVDAAGERCTGPILFGTDAFQQGSQLSTDLGGRAAVVADEASEGVFVVADNIATVALWLPLEALVSNEATKSIDALDATTELEATSAEVTGTTGPTSVDGSNVVTTSMPLPDAGGSVVVTSSVVDDVGLFGGSTAAYLALLGFGTILIALAGGTFLAERRTLERRATTDELTGLVNRREFERLTDEALLDASRFSTGLCVMLIDLNGFKQVNDTLGHQFGDLVLEACADRLVNAVRDTDVVGRWGGDEFVILLPGLEDGTAVRHSAERIAGQLGATPVVGDVSMSGAIGAALYPRHGETLDELVRAADVAMYEAKTSGVSHRLADAVTIDLASETVTDQYIGPDRRRHPAESDADRVR